MINKEAFTLIEVSILLLIIALLAGSVFSGKELIYNAQIRATISQNEQFNLAANAFKGKYNCLPGDCRDAVSKGLGVSGGVGDNGNGDDKIGVRVIGLCCYLDEFEINYFWNHLNKANLISENTASPYIQLPSSNINGNKGFWVVMHDEIASYNSVPISIWPGSHLFWIMGNMNQADRGAATLSGLDAYQIDAKLDDGLPLTGNVKATNDFTNDQYNYNGINPQLAVAAAGPDNCVTSDTTPSTYGANSTVRTSDSLCGLIFKASF